MRSLTSQTIQANPPCHPEAESREGVKGIPVGVKPQGPLRVLVACPACGQEWIAVTRRQGRKVRVDWERR